MQNDAISRSAVLDIIKEERRFIESLRETTFDNEDRAHNTGELGCAIRLARKIKDIPALDAAPVVRCEDCYWRSATGYCRRYGHSAPDGFFCADGKETRFVDKSSRKKDEEHCGARMDGEENAAD